MTNFLLVTLVAGACLAGRAEGAGGASSAGADRQPDDTYAVPPLGAAAATREPSRSSPPTALDTAAFVSDTSTSLRPFPCEAAGPGIVGQGDGTQIDMRSDAPQSVQSTGLNTAGFLSGIAGQGLAPQGKMSSSAHHPTNLNTTGFVSGHIDTEKGGGTQVDMPSGAQQPIDSGIARQGFGTQVDMTPGAHQSVDLDTAGFISGTIEKGGGTQADKTSSAQQPTDLNTTSFVFGDTRHGFISSTSSTVQPMQYDATGTAKNEIALAEVGKGVLAQVDMTSRAQQPTDLITAGFVFGDTRHGFVSGTSSHASSTVQPMQYDDVTGTAKDEIALAEVGKGVLAQVDMTSRAQQSSDLIAAGFVSNKNANNRRRLPAVLSPAPSFADESSDSDTDDVATDDGPASTMVTIDDPLALAVSNENIDYDDGAGGMAMWWPEALARGVLVLCWVLAREGLFMLSMSPNILCIVSFLGMVIEVVSRGSLPRGLTSAQLCAVFVMLGISLPQVHASHDIVRACQTGPHACEPGSLACQIGVASSGIVPAGGPLEHSCNVSAHKSSHRHAPGGLLSAGSHVNTLLPATDARPADRLAPERIENGCACTDPIENGCTDLERGKDVWGSSTARSGGNDCGTPCVMTDDSHALGGVCLRMSSRDVTYAGRAGSDMGSGEILSTVVDVDSDGLSSAVEETDTRSMQYNVTSTAKDESAPAEVWKGVRNQVDMTSCAQPPTDLITAAVVSNIAGLYVASTATDQTSLAEEKTKKLDATQATTRSGGPRSSELNTAGVFFTGIWTRTMQFMQYNVSHTATGDTTLAATKNAGATEADMRPGGPEPSKLSTDGFLTGIWARAMQFIQYNVGGIATVDTGQAAAGKHFDATYADTRMGSGGPEPSELSMDGFFFSGMWLELRQIVQYDVGGIATVETSLAKAGQDDATQADTRMRSGGPEPSELSTDGFVFDLNTAGFCSFSICSTARGVEFAMLLVMLAGGILWQSKTVVHAHSRSWLAKKTDGSQRPHHLTRQPRLARRRVSSKVSTIARRNQRCMATTLLLLPMVLHVGGDASPGRRALQSQGVAITDSNLFNAKQTCLSCPQCVVCWNSIYGNIGAWDVSAVTNMRDSASASSPMSLHPRLPARVPSDRVPSSVGCPTRVAIAARVEAATPVQGKPKRPVGCRPCMEVAGVWRGMWKRLRKDVFLCC